MLRSIATALHSMSSTVQSKTLATDNETKVTASHVYFNNNKTGRREHTYRNTLDFGQYKTYFSVSRDIVFFLNDNCAYFLYLS